MWKQVWGGLRSAAAIGSSKEGGERGMMMNMTKMGSIISIRHISRSSQPRNLRKINVKVPFEDATAIAESLYNLIKQHGPLTVSNTWNHSQEAGIGGLNSKTHMKLMLKWMRGRNMLKLFCNQVGSSKKFLHCTLPEDPQSEQSRKLMELKIHNASDSKKLSSPKRKKKQQLKKVGQKQIMKGGKDRGPAPLVNMEEERIRRKTSRTISPAPAPSSSSPLTYIIATHQMEPGKIVFNI